MSSVIAPTNQPFQHVPILHVIDTTWVNTCSTKCNEGVAIVVDGEHFVHLSCAIIWYVWIGQKGIIPQVEGSFAVFKCNFG